MDRILELEDDKKVVGIKNVTINESFFSGHFPGKPIMPGVLITEAMAQVGGIMMLRSRKDKRLTPFLTGIDKLRFRKPVVPGDQIRIESELLGFKSNIGKVKARALVDNQVVAEGEMMFALVEEKE